jgi:hypothetical protein
VLSDKPFTRKRIEQLFTDLGARLERRGVTGEVLVFVGAAMILAFNARAATRDIDAVFAPGDAVRTAADEVAQQHGLPRSWLNNQASSYLSLSAAEGKVPAFEAGGLRVYALAPQQLLAMKVLAGRPQQDAQDIRFLIDHLGLRTSREVLNLLGSIYPSQDWKAHARLLLEDILGEGRRH